MKTDVVLVAMSPETYRLAVHALMAVCPTGGGSYVNSAARELTQQVPVDPDYALVMAMQGTVVRELSDQSGQAIPERFLEFIQLRHPYDVK